MSEAQRCANVMRRYGFTYDKNSIERGCFESTCRELERQEQTVAAQAAEIARLRTHIQQATLTQVTKHELENDYMTATTLLQPKPLFCLGVFSFRLALMVTAIPLVGIGMLTGKIKAGSPQRYGQWAGTHWLPDGTDKHLFLVDPIDCSGFWKAYDIPDEPGIGLYEKTVSKIFNKFGWKTTVFYQLALRNIAQGWAYKWAVHYEGQIPAPQRTWKIFGFRYGWKEYQDWRSYSNEEIAANVFPVKRFYAVPDFFVTAEDSQ